MAKKVAQVIKLQAPAGAANPQPPLGPTLGQAGVNIMEFCKDFNAKTQQFDNGMPIPVVLTVYQDRSFSFIIKTPPAAHLLKKAAGLKKGTGLAGRETVGKVKKSQVREIAETKMKDLNANDIDQAMKIIEGTARSSGIEVVEG